jgi:hypothetical protein
MGDQSRLTLPQNARQAVEAGKRRRGDIWAAPPLRQLIAAISRLVYMDEAAQAKLGKDLSKAGLAISPREYMARKYIIVMGCVCLAALCAFFRFYLGLVFAVLLLVYGLMRHRDALSTRIRKKDAASRGKCRASSGPICSAPFKANRDSA